ncbi:NACHT domain-containing protein [Streptomyces morookaense]|uniref:NACHT domain-containing protein n=1 Tax=Streptomyces morookaense TaxID=1970 RepID=UPI0033E11CC2
MTGTVTGLFGALAAWAWRGDARRRRSGEEQVAAAVEVLARLVRRQWEEEAVLRQLFDPAPLPVVWADCALPGVGDHRELVGDAVTCRADRPEELAAAFRGLARRRLVVLGPAGSGKTTFAVLLVLALLRTRGPGDPVPVLCSPASFDPERESVRDWLRRRITAEYPALADTETYGATAVDDLIAERRVMPVLDGLDELPPPGRTSVLAALDDTLPTGAPLVLTCRTDEYRKAVTDIGVLSGAAVVEPAPVRIADALALLRLATPPGARQQRWDALAGRLARHPRGPAARALSSPLMVALARAVYADDGGDPAELADARRFPTPSDVEHHLLDALVPALYGRARRRDPAGAWDPERAHGWLARLAGGLCRRGTYDLAWWQLYGWVPALAGPWRRGIVWGAVTAVVLVPSQAAGLLAPGAPARVPLPLFLSRALVVAVVLGVGGSLPARGALLRRPGVMAAVLALCGGLTATPTILLEMPASHRGLGPMYACFLVFCLWLVLLGGGLPAPPGMPSRGTPARRHRRRRLLRAATTVAVVAAISGAACSLYATALPGPSAPWPRTWWYGTVTGAGLGAGLAALGWVRSTAHADELATMASSVRADRLIALVSGAACAAVFVLPDACVHAYAGTDSVLTGIGETVSGAAAGLLDGGVVAVVLALAARAWPHYTLARIMLAARGRLPWRLQTFLADAHRLGILRQVGPVHQFRHARLQHRLAEWDARLPRPRFQPEPSDSLTAAARDRNP